MLVSSICPPFPLQRRWPEPGSAGPSRVPSRNGHGRAKRPGYEFVPALKYFLGPRPPGPDPELKQWTVEGEMDNTPSKDDGYALPEKDDPWTLGDSQRERGSCGLRGGKPRPSARNRVRARATFLIVG
jgi:hypothetical protein